MSGWSRVSEPSGPRPCRSASVRGSAGDPQSSRPARIVAARDIAFAGMYFAHKYPERREQMDLLLGGAADAVSGLEHGFEIFSRFLGGDERYQFPGSLAQRVVGSLPYRNLLTAYKDYQGLPQRQFRRRFPEHVRSAGSSRSAQPAHLWSPLRVRRPANSSPPTRCLQPKTGRSRHGLCVPMCAVLSCATAACTWRSGGSGVSTLIPTGR